MKTITPRLLGRVLSWMPLLAWSALAALFLRARGVLGHWPRGYHVPESSAFPVFSELDPRELGWQYPLTLVGLGLACLALVWWCAIAWIGGSASKGEKARMALGLGAWAWVLLANPLDVWNWFLD